MPSMPRLRSDRSRRLLSGLLLLGLLSGCGAGEAPVAGSDPGDPPPAEPQVLRLSAPVGNGGDLVYLPFEVPAGVRRLEARLLDGSPENLGIGVFDPKGKEFLGRGFRGIAGKERRDFFITGDQATLGFVAGPIPAGTWHLVLPNYYASGSAELEVSLHFGTAAATPALQPVPEQLRAQAGWYRGDLHVHSEHSSDAFSSGKSLSPRAMAERAQARGLDFIALTDHNVATQNGRMPEAQPAGFLLLGGGEITTWIAGPGHLIVAGLAAEDFIDWRFRPVHGLWSKPQRGWGEDERQIQLLLDHARARGIYTSAAHPFVAPGFGSNWGYFTDSDLDPAALPDALEVWNNDFFISGGTATLLRWDAELARGRRLCGNGGSDLHGIDSGTEVGTPTTVVYATELSRAAVVAALQACRAYITGAPDGPALLLTASGPDGQQAMMGDWLQAGYGDSAEFTVRVLGGEAGRLILTRGGLPLLSRTVDSADQSFSTRVSLSARGAVRAELWPNALAAPLGLGPLALSNPIFYGELPPLPQRAPLPAADREQAIAGFAAMAAAP